MLVNVIDCTTITYNTMLDAPAKGYAMRATQLQEDVNDLRVEPDVITYSTIFKSYYMSGEIDLPLSVLKVMNSNGHVRPDKIKCTQPSYRATACLAEPTLLSECWEMESNEHFQPVEIMDESILNNCARQPR